MIGNIKLAVSARLGADGEPSAKVMGTCGYGDRTVTVSEDVTDKKALASIGKILKDAITPTIAAQLNQQATAAACEAFVVATKKGETLGALPKEEE